VSGLISGNGNDRYGRDDGYWAERGGLWAEDGRSYEQPRPRRGGRRRRAGRHRVLDMRMIVPIAIPMALALVLGMVLAMAGTHTTKISQAADGGHVNALTVLPADPPPTATAPVATANANMNCSLIVPAHPLTAAGLATPWQLAGPGGQDPNATGCLQTNPNNQAFVQATILDPDTGALAVYQPLVITFGTAPAAPPVLPQLPPNAVVNIMIGFNGNTLTLIGAQSSTLIKAHCVNGTQGSPFGQVSYCNSVRFYAAARADIAAGTLHVPANGTSPVTGQSCPTTRSFQVVDQDQSDNVTTQYLLTATGQTAQDNAANKAALPGAMRINNGSDNRLLDAFLLPALGCAPFTAPDLSAGGAPGTSQTLDELSAMVNQQAPHALVPMNDPMTMINGMASRAKTNLYRLGVGQPLLGGYADGVSLAGGLTQVQMQLDANYCASMLNQQSAFLVGNMARFANVTSPVPAMGSNLFTFLAARLSASFTNLNCQDFGLGNPVTVSTDGNGVAVAALINVVHQVPQLAAQPGPQPGQVQAQQSPAAQQPSPAPQATQAAQASQTAQGVPWWQQAP